MEKLDKCLLRITTPDKVVMEQNVSSVNVKTYNGYATFLPNHSPLISTIKPGTITIKIKESKEVIYAILDGTISVTPDNIDIITNEIIAKHDIDIKKAENKIKKYSEILEKEKDHNSYNYKNAKLKIEKSKSLITTKTSAGEN